jgi:hypothetical protein
MEPSCLSFAIECGTLFKGAGVIAMAFILFVGSVYLLSVPVLALGHVDGSDLDLWQLRALGVVGLMDLHALPEHVRFRINQAIYSGLEGRRHERAPCSIAVELEANGAVSEERAVTLSEGGMCLSSHRCIEPNTDVVLRFGLDSDPGERLTLEGRVIHAREVQRRETRYEVGLFFREASERAIAAIREEVRCLLDAVGGEWLGPVSRSKPGRGPRDAREVSGS